MLSPATNLLQDRPPTVACAVYTRTSSAETGDQSFGSIDAQREAALDYIISQRDEHWQAVSERFDDPEVSGASLQRPALQRLLDAIRNEVVHVVVVYKLDRLTRSLVDFTVLMGLFEQHHVSLVSVTQDINTTDAAGRLTMNVLMSFAQFERELIGERRRDTTRATRRQGLWAGGVPPLGYRQTGVHLEVFEAEAEIVRLIFDRFVELGSATALIQELGQRGITTPVRTSKRGRQRGGRPFDKTILYKLLRNRIYLGEIYCDDTWQLARHPPLITTEQWDAVHAVMNSRRRPPGRARERPALMLQGMIFGNDGRAYSPWRSTLRGNRYYVYYVPQKAIAVGAAATELPRLSAHDIEALVTERVRQRLRTPWEGITPLPAGLAIHNHIHPGAIEEFLADVDRVWDLLMPPITHSILRTLVSRVIIHPDQVVIDFRASGPIDLFEKHVAAERAFFEEKRRNLKTN